MGEENPKKTLNASELEEVRKVFNRFDANGDGKISEEELAGVMKALGTDTTAEEISRTMQEVDADKDGVISLEEFASFYGSSECGSGEIRDAFDLYDQDHDGFITVTELHQILTRLGERCSVEDCGVMIQSVDADDDGRVNFEEFKTMMTKAKKSEP